MQFCALGFVGAIRNGISGSASQDGPGMAATECLRPREADSREFQMSKVTSRTRR